MTNADLAFLSLDIKLSVRAFSVKDGLSRLFDVFVTACSEAADLNLDEIVGHPAAFRLPTRDPEQPYAVWSGICSEVEQIGVEEDGISIYALRIVPMMWRCTQRRNYRVYQHQSTAEIVISLLGEWGIEVEQKLDEKLLPRHEYRVQFGESDFAFVSRLMEADGLSYRFEQIDPRGAEKKDERELPSMRLVITEGPAETATRLETPVPYAGNTEAVETSTPFVTRVCFGRKMRAGRFTLAGYDYRSSPELKLLSEARSGIELEERYEMFHYIPGAFLAEQRADEAQAAEATDARERAARRRSRASRQQGASLDEDAAKKHAAIGLERVKSDQRRLSFYTNQLVLAPGIVFTMDGHPRRELSKDTPLLVLSRCVEGEHDKEWHSNCDAIIATDPYRPALSTPKPRVMGVQSAIVVGPRGEEIYTDKLGRVRVQFHWDRYGKHDEHSSCWIRVSQAWAGSGYGIHAVPRVGHEVLIDFFEGDPDRPIVVGRAHHQGATPPDALPKEKTKTTWRSNSTPGGEGFNEISMTDARGEELLSLRAQKDLKQVVLEDQTVAIGQDLQTTVRRDEKRLVNGKQEIEVKGDQKTAVSGVLTTRADRGLQVQAGEVTGVSVADGKLVLSNGQASIVLDGPNLYIDAMASLRLSGGRMTQISGKKVTMDGRPEVFINSGNYLAPEVSPLVTMQRGRQREAAPRRGGSRERPERGRGEPRRPGGMREAEFDGKQHLLDVINRQLGTKWKWPRHLVLPPEYDEQLERAGRLAFHGNIVRGKLMDPETYRKMKLRIARRLNLERSRLNKLGTDFQNIIKRQAGHYGDVTKRLGARLTQEQKFLGEFNGELKAIFAGERGGLWDSSKALFGTFKDQAKRIMSLKRDLVAMVNREIAYVKRFKREWAGYFNEVKETLDHWKEIIENPRDTLVQTILGDELAEDIVNLADDLGYGEEVADFLGVDPPGDPSDGLPGRPPGGGRPEVPGGRRPMNDNPLIDRGVSRGANRQIRAGKGQRLKSFSRAQKKGLGNPLKGRTLKNKQGMRHGLGNQSMNREAGGRLTQGALGKQRGVGIGADGSAADKAAAGRLSGDKLAAARGLPDGGVGGVGGGDGAGGHGSVHPSVISQSGGIAAGDVASAVNSDGPSFLQTPGEGQLMVLPNEGAGAIDQVKLQAAMVDAQMQGKPVSSAIADSLGQQGYEVYSRGWGDWFSEFVHTAESHA